MGAAMRIINWIISILFGIYVQIIEWRRSVNEAADQGSRLNSDIALRSPRNFDQDYRDATAILRLRLDRKFPDGQYARLRSESATPYDNGESRVHAVDQMSAAIASALRKGATVREAAEAGAASIDI